ncbi:MAG: BlaI/MecI/CopY family transcriptional regulator [Cyclobacteriaceae bacterium]
MIVITRIDELPDEPKPPYNTVSSVVRLLEKKGFLTHKAYGKTYEYYPLISKSAYLNMYLKKLLTGYFENSPASLLSFLIRQEKLDEEEISKLKKIIDQSEQEPPDKPIA